MRVVHLHLLYTIIFIVTTSIWSSEENMLVFSSRYCRAGKSIIVTNAQVRGKW